MGQINFQELVNERSNLLRARCIGGHEDLVVLNKLSRLSELISSYIRIHWRNSIDLYFALFRYEDRPDFVGVDFYIVIGDNKHLVYSMDPKRFFKGHGIHSCLEECARVLREDYGEEIKLDIY